LANFINKHGRFVADWEAFPAGNAAYTKEAVYEGPARMENHAPLVIPQARSAIRDPFDHLDGLPMDPGPSLRTGRKDT